MRDWFWQLQAAGKGPDWFFFATFAPAADARLAALVRQQSLPGFVFAQVTTGCCTRHQRHTHYAVYTDHHNAAQMLANLAEDQPRNLWIYHTIEVCADELTIARGSGGYPGLHGATETAFIAALAHHPALLLVDWQVVYGGQGYDGGQVATGTSAASLLAYLHHA